MKTMKTIGLLTAMSFALAGCLGGEPGSTEPWMTPEPGNNQPTNNQSPNNQSTNNQSTNNGSTNNGSTNNGSTNNGSTNSTTPVEPSERAELGGTYISGHLGSYWDCPGQGYTGEEEGAAEPGSDGDFAEGDCAEDSCGFLNCQDAQMTLLLTNNGQIVAKNIALEQIRLLDLDETELGILPLISLVDAETGEAFDGELAVGEQVRLRVDFQGPENLYQLREDAKDDAGDEDGISDEDSDRSAGNGALIELIFSADDADDERVISKEVYDVPAVDT